jgi:nicotinamide-nucleotide amidase
VKAAIFSTGDELINGKTMDTNAHWLIKQLTALDVDVVCQIDVGDVQSEIVWGLEQTTQQADLVVMTGGLGPTDDDLTRFALAELADVKLSLHDESLEQIKKLFASRQKVMNDRNRIQAMMPEGAEVLDNPTGTAPGIKMTFDKSTVFALPGVPREMKLMYDLYVRPWVETKVRATTYRRRLHCIGIGESDLVHQVNDLVKACQQVIFGTTANEGIISIGLAGKDKAAIDALDQAIRERLGTSIFGIDEETLPAVVGDLLKKRNETLATAESCTGGLIGKMLTDIPGSSEYYLGGFVCYQNRLKEKLVNVPTETLEKFGAVSEPVAKSLAEGTLKSTESDWAIGVTGIAGPGGGTETKPVGLVYISLAGRDGTCEVKEYHFGNPGRETVRFRTAITALDMLRRALLKSRPR